MIAPVVLWEVSCRRQTSVVLLATAAFIVGVGVNLGRAELMRIQ